MLPAVGQRNGFRIGGCTAVKRKIFPQNGCEVISGVGGWGLVFIVLWATGIFGFFRLFGIDGENGEPGCGPSITEQVASDPFGHVIGSATLAPAQA